MDNPIEQLLTLIKIEYVYWGIGILAVGSYGLYCIFGKKKTGL